MSTGREVIRSPPRHTSNWFTVQWRSRSAAASSSSFNFVPNPEPSRRPRCRRLPPTVRARPKKRGRSPAGTWDGAGPPAGGGGGASSPPGRVVKKAPRAPSGRSLPARSREISASSRSPPLSSRAARASS